MPPVVAVEAKLAIFLGSARCQPKSKKSEEKKGVFGKNYGNPENILGCHENENLLAL